MCDARSARCDAPDPDAVRGSPPAGAVRSEEAQRERALQAWELVLLDAPDPGQLETLRRILRLKRFELQAFSASMPGRLRRGARVDLVPIEQALVRAGIRCALRPAEGLAPDRSAGGR